MSFFITPVSFPDPRIARIIATGHPHHITQRGNNRSVVFFDDEDRQKYLEILAANAPRHSVQIGADCLMDNHIHLLVVPETETGLARGIGVTNLVYTQYLTVSGTSPAVYGKIGFSLA